MLKGGRVVGDRLPGSDVHYLRVDIGDADGGAQQLLRALARDPLRDVGGLGLRRVARRVHNEEAGPRPAVEPEEAAQHVVEDVEDRLRTVADQLLAVRAEVDRDAV